MRAHTIQERYLPEFVYGSIDGLVTTFAIVSGVMGAQLSVATVLVLGVANVFADGFSMGSSAYLSARSETSAIKRDLARQGKTPLSKSLMTFLAFVGVGFVPLVPFVAGLVLPEMIDHAFKVSILLTGVAFLVVGYIEGRVTGKHQMQTALTTFAVGSIAAGISFVVGFLLRGIA